MFAPLQKLRNVLLLLEIIHVVVELSLGILHLLFKHG